MPLSVGKNNKGFTLVEVMIAMFILMIGSLAIAQVAVMVVDTNMSNILRDEAVRIADERINGTLTSTTNVRWDGLANLNITSSVPTDDTLQKEIAAGQQTITVNSISRGIQRNYTVTWLVTQISQPSAIKTQVFRVQVWVGWNYKGGATAGLAPTGSAFQHGISRFITRNIP
jgi:prepilin-type N-terminal cleavage/methylation domain-containing protein